MFPSVDSLFVQGAAANSALGAGLTADAANTNTCQERLDPSDPTSECIKGGWMDVVRPLLMGPDAYLFLFRETPHRLRIIIPARPRYDIFAPDLINIYIPPEAVLSAQLIVAPTQIRIEATQVCGPPGGGGRRILTNPDES